MEDEGIKQVMLWKAKEALEIEEWRKEKARETLTTDRKRDTTKALEKESKMKKRKKKLERRRQREDLQVIEEFGREQDA